MFENKKQELIRYAMKMSEDGLVRGTGGNISVFCRDKERIIITPSGVEYGDLKLVDIPVIDLEGNVIEGSRLPSTELALHTKLYKSREDIDAIFHVHSTYLTVLATLREPLPASNYMIALTGGEVPCADYATFGTEELAEKAVAAIGDHNAVLLANHGALAGGKSILEAYNLISELEECAKIYTIARSIGEPVLLTEKEVLETKEKFDRDYGQHNGE